MYRHMILTATSYSFHQRAALDVVSQGTEIQETQNIIEEVTMRNKHKIPFSLHFKKAFGPNPEDVVKEDPYFKGVYFCRSIKEFMSFLESDLFLTSTDIAKYILAKIDCPSYRLQILTSLCFVKYFEKTGKKLFQDGLYVLDTVPVAEDLFLASKDYPGELLRNKLIDQFDELSQTVLECRMQRAEDGFTKIAVIDKTLEKYSELSERELSRIIRYCDFVWGRSCEAIDREAISDENNRSYCSAKIV